MEDQINDLVRLKQDIYEKAFSSFDGTTASLEATIFENLFKIYNLVSIRDGIIEKDPSKVGIASKEIIKILSGNKFSSQVSKYFKNFDDVEAIQKKILETGNPDLNLKDYDLGNAKKELTDEIVKGVLSKKAIEANMVAPIKKLVFKHLTTGVKYSDAIDELKAFILKSEDKRGFLGQYVTTLVREPLMRYDGAINQKVADEFKLDGFRIVGSLIKTSLPVCNEMIKGAGRFKALYKNGKYRIEDIPKIIELIKNDKGFVPGTNKSNYFINRNHWGCRHTFIPTRLLAKDLAEDEPVFESKASSIKEVKTELQDLFKRNLNITPSISFSSKLSVEKAKARTDEIARLFSKYNIANKIDEKLLVSAKSTNRSYGYVKYSYSGTVGELNVGHLTESFKSYEKVGLNRFKSRVDFENVEIATTTHEFAHFISLSYFKHPFFKELEAVMDEYFLELKQIRNNPNSTENDLDEIFLGSYASKNINEFFAEGFKEFELKSNPSKYAKKIGSLAQRFFGK